MGGMDKADSNPAKYQVRIAAAGFPADWRLRWESAQFCQAVTTLTITTSRQTP